MRRRRVAAGVAVALAGVTLAATMLGGRVNVFDGSAPTPAPTPDPGVANAWVKTGGAGATPSRCSAPCEYDATHAYGSVDTAWDAAAAGDTIRLKAGTYPPQRATGDKASDTKIIGEDGTTIGGGTVECRHEFGGDSAFCARGTHMWLENVTIDSGTEAAIGASSRIWPKADDVTFRNVDLVGDFPGLYIEGDSFHWLGGSHGQDGVTPPRIRCTTGAGEPTWILAPGTVIDGVRMNVKLVQTTPTPNVGSCGPDGVPHLETIRLESAANDTTIRNTLFAAGSDAGSGHIFSSTVNNNLKLINNVFEPTIGSTWAQLNALPCDYTFAYNTFEQGGAVLGCASGTWVGNLGEQTGGCEGTHTKNVWSGTGSCGTDTFLGGASLGIGRFGRLDAGSPAIGGAETPGPSAACTDPALVNSLDIDGDTRPFGSICDAGADEYRGR